jgi:threonine dehydrogenase-like Zn-dependent dehydrogenase
MLAAILTKPESFELIITPVPTPDVGEVRIRVKGCGVCASSLPIWQGRPWFNYPVGAGLPGHEMWGVVDATGPGVSQLQAGMPVAALTYRSFAEFDIARAEDIVPLPVSLTETPLPAEAIACAVNIFRRSALRPADHVAIVGVGFLGGVLTQMCARAGATVIALSRRPFALDLAHSCGAAYTLPLLHESMTTIREITDNRGCECVIETAGLQVTLDFATELVASGGRLVIGGYHQDGFRQVNMQKWNWLGIEIVNAHERDPAVVVAALRDAVEAVNTGALDLSSLITHRVTLANLNEAFRNLAERPDGFVKAVVEF